MIAVRCIDEADKSASVGFSVAVLSMLALVPAPIFFGYVLGKYIEILEFERIKNVKMMVFW